MTNNVIEEWEDWNPEQWFQNITSTNNSLSSLKIEFNSIDQEDDYQI